MIGIDDRSVLGTGVWSLHAGSCSLVVEPANDALLNLFEREAGRRLPTLDPNVRLTVEPDVALRHDRITRLVLSAHIVKVRAEELGLLHFGAPGSEIAGTWLTAGDALVVVTRESDAAE